MTPPPRGVDVTSEVKVLEFRVHALEDATKDQEERLRKMEKMIWVAMGAVSVMSMLGSILGRMLTP